MRYRFVCLSVLLAACISGFGQQQNAPAPVSAVTAVPRLVRFSGQLKNASGTVGITFTLHQGQQGNTALWIETQNVQLDSAGRYSVLLGATKTEGIPAELFTSGEAQWLGIRVEGQPEQPRVLLVSVPYALKAGEADTLAGHTASEFVTSDKLSSAVQQQLQAAASGSPTGSTVHKNSVNKNSTPVDGATNFTDTTTNQVVLVTQQGTGAGLVATAGNNYAFSGTSTNTAIYGSSNGASHATAAALEGVTTASQGRGIFGWANTTTGVNFGLYGQANSVSGTGIAAASTATTGTTVGLEAQDNSPSGTAAVIQARGGGKIISGQSGASNAEVFSVDGSGDVKASGRFSGDGSGLSNVVLVGPYGGYQFVNTASLTGADPVIAITSSFSNGGNSYLSYLGTQQDGGFVAVGNFGASTIPYTSSGTLMEWYPGKAAFRAGFVDGSQWADSNIGNYSAAFGFDNTVSGDYSLAQGYANTVIVPDSIAFGTNNVVAGSGVNFAFGQSNTTGGAVNAVFGVGNYALGSDEVVGGGNAVANGTESFAFGGTVGACAGYNVALGYYVSTDPAVQNNSGYSQLPCSTITSTVGYTGSFIWGDLSPSGQWTTSHNNNEFRVRAQGGLAFRTSPNANSALGTFGATGCDLPGGSGTWSCSSSRTIKENFMLLNNADVLSRLRAMPVTTWNYIAEGKQARHLGPVAEDFYAAFGLGENNTSVGVNDLAGVGLAAAKALDERTLALQQQNDVLKKQVAMLTVRLNRLERTTVKRKSQLVTK